MDILQGAQTPSIPQASQPNKSPEYQDHLVTAYRYLSPYLTPVLRTTSTLRRTTTRLLAPYLSDVTQIASDSPTLVSFFALLFILIVSLQALSYARRIILWWASLLFTFAFYVCFGLALYTVWQRGVARTAGEAVEWGREIVGVWQREYERWEGYQNQKAMGGGKGAGTGWQSAGNRAGGNARAGWR